jgi:error-prone DNA polymerase
LLVYASCWFKAYYPDVFCAAILNAQPMGFYAPAQLVRDARDHGIEIRPVDINHSIRDCTLEASPFNRSKIAPQHNQMRGVIKSRYAVRLGFRQIKGLGKDSADALAQHRGAGYQSVRDVWLRSGIDAGAMERLAQADAFRSIGLDRRKALWEVRALEGKSAAERLPMFETAALPMRDNEPAATLPAMRLGEHVIHDYRSLSLSLKAHPVSFFRERLRRSGVTPNVELKPILNGKQVAVAGLVLVRQRPGSAKGVIFMTVEDEVSIANIIVWKKTFETFRSVVLGARFVRIRGKLQSASGVIHIVADRIEDLTPWLSDLSEQAGSIETCAHADEVKHGSYDPRAKPARSETLAIAARDFSREQEDRLRKARDVMPKGRNFQ